MLIIVEGPDGAGKTTVVEMLRKETQKMDRFAKIEVLRKGPATQHPLDEYESPLLSYRPGGMHHIICDRWHVGEWVYPHIMGRSTQADRAVWYHVELFLQSRGALIVHMTREPGVLFSRVTDRGDDFISPMQVVPIASAYTNMITEHVAPIQYYISDVESVEGIILDALAQDANAVKLNGLVTYVGPPKPERLLIGDVRNGVDPLNAEGDIRPAFMPYRSTSGHYLLSLLRRSMMHGLGIINACDVDVFSEAYDILGRPPAVALGSNAYAATVFGGDLQRGITGVPHPQFIRRFHNKDTQAYEGAIRAAFGGEDLIKWRP